MSSAGGPLSGARGYRKQASHTDTRREELEMRDTYRGKGEEAGYSLAVNAKMHGETVLGRPLSRDEAMSSDGRSGSQDSILEPQGAKAIMRTREVRVTVQPR